LYVSYFCWTFLYSSLLFYPEATSGAHHSPFTNERPGTPGGVSTRSSQYPPVAAPNTPQAQSYAHPGYPSQMNQYPPSHTRDPSAQQFIPTPSQALEYRHHADTSRQSHRRTGSVSSPLNPGYNPSPPIATQIPPNVPLSQHYPTQYASTSAITPNYPSTTAGDRFVCSRCGATFSRAHDRKRHYETQHLESPPVHRCQHCQREFSRSDSLKRHLDKGCDSRD
jgi:Zinc finger, C2H2 type